MPPKGWKKNKAEVALVTGPVTFDSSEQMSEGDFADVQFLTKVDQFKGLRKWFLIDICANYRQAASNKDEAYVFCRIAKNLEDMLVAIESLGSLAEKPVMKDAFDDEDIQKALSSNDLPLAPEP